MRRPTVLLALLVTLVSACPDAEPDEVRIGLVAALSGTHAAVGSDVERGAQMAVDDLNEAGGLLGRRLELVVRDSTASDTTRILRDLVRREHVSAVIGPENPAVLLGTRSPLAAGQVPAVLATAFAGDLSEAPSIVVRPVPSTRDQAVAVGGWLVRERGIARAAVLITDPLEAVQAEDDLAAGLRSAGVEVTAMLRADPAPDLTAAVGRIRERAGDVGAVFLWGPPAVVARATSAVRASGWDVQIVVPSSAFVGEYRALTRQDSEGVVLPFPFREQWFEADVQDFFVRWHRRHRIDAIADLETLVLDLPVAGIAAYDAVGIIASAVTGADSRDPSDVGEALTRTTHEGLLRTYRFEDREAWNADDLYIARFHNLAVVYDVDPRMDIEAQRRFHDRQVRLDFLPDDVLAGRAGELLDDVIERRREMAPSYRAPHPGPEPVARPRDHQR